MTQWQMIFQRNSDFDYISWKICTALIILKKYVINITSPCSYVTHKIHKDKYFPVYTHANGDNGLKQYEVDGPLWDLI